MALALPHMVGEYKLLNHIDDGGFGAVYRAHILNSPNKIVAVKWSHPDAFVDPRDSSRPAKQTRLGLRAKSSIILYTAICSGLAAILPG